MGTDNDNSSRRCLRIAAAGDVHCSEGRREEIERAVRGLAGTADLLLLCGDLTTHGEPDQAAILARACTQLEMPCVRRAR